VRILIIEDDKSTSDFLKEALTQERYAVDTAFTGEEGESLAETVSYDAILLDIILPGKDGIQVCADLRRKKVDTPILILTCKSEDSDITRGLDSGADDYLTKPFTIDVLLSRLRALIRRGQNSINPDIKVGNLILDTVNQQFWQGTREITLTSKEYAILEYLAGHPDSLITRSTLEQHIWNLNTDSGSNVIDAHIKNLRAKLGEENRGLIQTIRGRGYQLRKTL
jgi:DNA-binding response OmpR family regulator